MFQYFIYFIVALLIYTTYHHSQTTNFSGGHALALFLGATVLFIQFVRIQFARLEKRADIIPPSRLEHLFNLLIGRFSILALILFAFNIYGLNLSEYLIALPVFSHFPTLLALLFMMLFVFYLAVVWWFAYDIHQKLGSGRDSRMAYTRSNVVFAMPILLPWLIISGLTDLIRLSPLEGFKALIATPWGEALYLLTFLVAIAVLGPAMIQHFWNCAPVEHGILRDRIEALCKRAGVGYRNIMYWPLFGGRMITAGVMGLVQRFRYILITPGLVRNLSPSEIDAVIAHEIGHVRYRHLLLYLLFFIGFMLLSIAGAELILLGLMMSDPFHWLVKASGMEQNTLLSMSLNFINIVLLVLYFRYIFGYFMRNFERQADTFVYSMFDSAAPLISTFYKIAHASAQAPDKKNWHHFSIKERIDFLQHCEADRSQIKKHNSKVWRNLILYGLVLVSLTGIGYGFNYGEFGRRLIDSVDEKTITREIQRSPENADLFSMLGEIYLRQKNYSDTILAYEQSLRLKPRNPHVLNNLAWLYATCPDRSMRDPQRALILARQAAKLQPAAHVLDTLAESYFINGFKEEAIAVAREALKIATEKRSYYEEQLIKFESQML